MYCSDCVLSCVYYDVPDGYDETEVMLSSCCEKNFSLLATKRGGSKVYVVMKREGSRFLVLVFWFLLDSLSLRFF